MEKIILKNETYLPVFSGFYGSIWDFDFSSIEYDIKEGRKEKGLYSEIDFDDVKIDLASYEADIVQGFAKALQERLSDFDVYFEVQNIVHPKAYNFKNDSVNLKVLYDGEKIKDFIYSNREKFCAYLKARYTSYDGFISWYSNDFEKWEKESNNFSDFSANGHFLGSILDFICHVLKIEEASLYDEVIENIYTSNYAENIDEIINQMDGSLFEMLTSQGINRGFAEYIETSFQNGMMQGLSLSEKILSIVQEFENQVVEA